MLATNLSGMEPEHAIPDVFLIVKERDRVGQLGKAILAKPKTGILANM